MAGSSCSLSCNIKDADGKVKPSALFEELRKFFKGDRKKAVTHYFLTKDSKFLQENSDVLEFDADGEVTLNSLKKALDRDGEYGELSDNIILSTLNDEIKKEVGNRGIGYSEALDNVLRFNKGNQFRDGFMATLVKKDNGKYSVEVVPRSSDAEYALAEHVQNKIMTDAVRLLLEKHGLSVEFLDDANYASKYTTQIDGVDAAIKIANGERTAANIAEAAGHFLVAAMKDTPLVQRLLNTLTSEVQQRIFTDSKSPVAKDDFIVSDADESKMEAAGILVGWELLNPLRKVQRGMASNAGNLIPRGIRGLLKKIGEFAKRIFGIYKPDTVKILSKQALEAASGVAQGYLSNPDIADAETAFSTPETYVREGNLSMHMSEEVKRNVKAYYETLGSLKSLVSELKSFVYRAEDPTSKEIYKKLKEIVGSTVDEYNHQMKIETFAEAASIQGITAMLDAITEVLDTDVKNLLESIQPVDRAASYNKLIPNVRSLRTVAATVQSIGTLHGVLAGKISSMKDNADIKLIENTLVKALERLGDVLVGEKDAYTNINKVEQSTHGLAELVELKRRQVFTDAITDFYGKDFIERNAGIIWIQDGWRRKLVRSDMIEGYRKRTVSELVGSMELDISWFDRFLSSAADCGDFIIGVGNKIVKQANMEADRLAAMFWDRIEALNLQMQDLFGSNDWTPLLEVIDAVDEDGNIKGTIKSGNFVSRVNYGAWEAEREKFKKELRKQWKEHFAKAKSKAYENNRNDPAYVFDLTDAQLGIMYHNFVDPKWDAWHKEHSDEDRSQNGYKVYVPKATKYHSQQWDDLFDTSNPALTEGEKALRRKRLKWFESFMELKDDMDGLLPKGATVRNRVPQLTGRLSHRYRNLKAQMENSRSAMGHAIRLKSQDWFKITPEEAYMFGSNSEFNEIEEDPVESDIFYEKDKVNRLPMYGINKLKDMNNLSTDIFGTMLQYGSMAATYNAMERVADVFELGKDVMRNRDKEWREKNNKSKESRTCSRYMKFVEKSIYGINVSIPQWDRKGTWRKLLNGFSSLGGRILLYGNLHGGIVNTGTGILEILKEATAGENFNFSDLNQALQMYYSGLLSTDGYFGTLVGNALTNPQRPDDKNSLWIRHWNILSENRSFLRNQRYDVKAMSLLDNRLWDWFGHTMMLPYSSGDHFMQTIPYYAMGVHQKVYDRNGKRMRLIDAYEITDGEEVFAIESQLGDKPLGMTPKKLKLKEGIFRSVGDIKKYDTVVGMLNKIADFFEAHPNIKNNQAFSFDLLSREDIEYLEDEGLQIPTTVKQLDTLKTTLNTKKGQLVFNSTDESEFMDKCRNICNRLHGIYNSEDRVTFQQHWYGNLVMALRGYALGMYNRRFADSRYNVALDRVVEGSYNTFSKVMLMSLFNLHNADNWKALGEALLLTIPVANAFALKSSRFSNRLKADMVKAGFSPHQYYNMRRTGADFLVLEGLALLNLLSAPGRHFGLSGDEDEDKNKKVDTSDNWWAGLLYYFTMRWYNEQAAFTTIGGMWNESTSLLDYIPVGLSGSKLLLWDIAKLFMETEIDKIGGPDYNNSDLYYQSTKEGKYKEGDAKWWVKFKRICPYWRSYYVLSHPYDAASSYEYGRRVRGK